MQTLVHVWRVTKSVTITCPPGLPGAGPPGSGFIDPHALTAAYRESGIAWGATILALVLACYLTGSASLNRGFVVKWWLYWLAAVVLGALVPLAVLSTAPLHALAGSCATLPTAFAVRLAFGQILPTMELAALWSLVAFPILSLLLTVLAGWHPASRGFFHYRGCPWPRWNPFAS